MTLLPPWSCSEIEHVLAQRVEPEQHTFTFVESGCVPPSHAKTRHVKTKAKHNKALEPQTLPTWHKIHSPKSIFKVVVNSCSVATRNSQRAKSCNCMVSSGRSGSRWGFSRTRTVPDRQLSWLSQAWTRPHRSVLATQCSVTVVKAVEYFK